MVLYIKNAVGTMPGSEGDSSMPGPVGPPGITGISRQFDIVISSIVEKGHVLEVNNMGEFVLSSGSYVDSRVVGVALSGGSTGDTIQIRTGGIVECRVNGSPVSGISKGQFVNPVLGGSVVINNGPDYRGSFGIALETIPNNMNGLIKVICAKCELF